MIHEILVEDGPNIWVCGRADVEKPPVDTLKSALISIRDSDKVPANTKWPNISDTLFVSFDDVDEDRAEFERMSQKEADRIAKFALTAWENNAVIICQCEAGISRSAAVAAAILRQLTGDDSAVFTNRYFYPNRHVYRNVLSALIKEAYFRLHGKYPY